MALSVAVHGAGGRMGRALIRAIANDAGASLAAALDRASAEVIGQDAGVIAGLAPMHVPVSDDAARGLNGADVVIDFTLPQATGALLAACRQRRLPLVMGTTGLDADQRRALDELATHVPLVYAHNFSAGVNVLWHLAERAVGLLGADYDIEIVEMHHRHKVDAPSGTAVRLAEAAAQARGLDPERDVRHGRSGHVGARSDREIGVLSLRGGDVVGEHSLVLAGPGERLEVTHRAHTREIFANGALRAAHWVTEQPPGRYTMSDVLGM